MIRIAIAGGPGTGKTTLSRLLVTELFNNRYVNAQPVHEYARDYINSCRRAQGGYQNRLSDQMHIFRSQLEREESLDPKTVTFMVTDSPLLLTPVYSYPTMTCGPNEFQDYLIYSRLYTEWLPYRFRYDYVFLLGREQALLKDGTRGESDEEARGVDRRIAALLDFHQIPYELLMGSHEDRLNSALLAIAEAGDLPPRP